MRLVDADALESETCCGCKNYEHKYANCIDCALANAPTIDAIPLEWLRDKMQKPRVTVANPFGYVLAEWLEEQEGR